MVSRLLRITHSSDVLEEVEIQEPEKQEDFASRCVHCLLRRDNDEATLIVCDGCDY